jgi:hypothetical protein
MADLPEPIVLTAEEQALANSFAPQPETTGNPGSDDNYYGTGFKKDQVVTLFKTLDPELDYEKTKIIIQQHKELQNEVNNLRNQPQSSFHNEVVETINELYANGASQDEIDAFLSIQKMDISKMSDIDAVRMKMQFEYPGVDSDTLDGMLENEIGTYNLENLDKAQKAKLVVKSKEARAFIATKKKDLKATGSGKKQEQLAHYQALAQRWNFLNKAAVDNYNSVFQIPVEHPKTGKNIGQVKLVLTEDTKKQLVGELTKNALHNNLPMSAESAPIIKNIIKVIMCGLYGDEIKKQSAALAYTAALHEFHNTNNPNAAPPNTKILTESEQAEENKAIGNFFGGKKN